jgi:hypothetical protein
MVSKPLLWERHSTYLLVHSAQGSLHDTTCGAKQHGSTCALAHQAVKLALWQLVQLDAAVQENLANLCCGDDMVNIT